MSSGEKIHRPGWLIAVDAEGAEIAEARRSVSGLTIDRVKAMEAELRAGLGVGCYVVFREQ